MTKLEIIFVAALILYVVIYLIISSKKDAKRRAKLKTAGIETVAEISKIEQNRQNTDDDNWHFYAKFTDEHGIINEIYLGSSILKHCEGLEVGKKIRIRYLPGDVETFEILPDEAQDESSGS